MRSRRQTTYTDELLADGTVHRRYGDGRREWRRRGEGRTVRWRDDQGADGTDELLGKGIVKRQYADGRLIYGRELGYGRTVWGRGDYVTLNRTSFGGRIGRILGGVTVVMTLGTATYPPTDLSPDQEDELRRAGDEAEQGGSGEVDDPYGGDWDDGGGDFGGDDFG